MNDDPTLDRLDARGRAAAAGLRTAVAERPIPVFDPDAVPIDVDGRPTGPRRRRAGMLLAVAAALVIVAGAVAALALGGEGGDEQEPVDGVGAADLRRYVLGTVPDGFALVQVHDQVAPLPDADLWMGEVTVLGPSIDAPAVGLGVLSPDAVPEEGAVEIEVAGRTAWRVPGYGPSTLIVEVGDSHVASYGGATPLADLEEVLGALRVEDEGLVVPDDALPDGWSELGVVHADDIAPMTVSLRSGSDVRLWSATYATDVPADEDGDSISVTSRSGSALEVHAGRLASPDAREVTVRGHSALLVTSPDIDLPDEPDAVNFRWTTVTWEERPGEVVSVGGSVTEDALLAAAADVVVVAPSEVQALRADAMRFGVDGAAVTVLGEGRFSDGSPWLLIDDVEQGFVDLRTTIDSAGMTSDYSVSGTAGDDVDPLDPQSAIGDVTVRRGEQLGWVYGWVEADVDRVEVRTAAGGEVVTEATMVGDGDRRGWVAEVPVAGWSRDDTPDWEVVALDAGGSTLGVASIE